MKELTYRDVLGLVGSEITSSLRWYTFPSTYDVTLISYDKKREKFPISRRFGILKISPIDSTGKITSKTNNKYMGKFPETFLKNPGKGLRFEHGFHGILSFHFTKMAAK